MTTEHYLLCEAPICQGDPNPLYKIEVVWRPGELVCLKKPYTKFQKKQLEINKLVAEGKFKNMDVAYKAQDLETKSI